MPEMGRAGEGEMPKELITSTTVTDDHVYTRSLHVAWGAKGGRPEAPDGWVNAGFAEIQIRHDDFTAGTLIGINLDPDEIDHLIHVLKRVKRQAHPHQTPCIDGNVCGGPHCPPADPPALIVEHKVDNAFPA